MTTRRMTPLLLALGLLFSVFVGAAGAAEDAPANVGLFDDSTGRWHLRAEDGSEVTFFYGNPGDVPLMGDWDCDGIDTVAMFRPSSGFAYLRNSNDFGVADIDFFYGIKGDIPLAGDWDGDGCDTLAIYRSGRVFLSNQLGTRPADKEFFFGIPGDRPFAGDFDGDGIDTIGLYRESSGFVYFTDDIPAGDVATTDNEFFYGAPSDRIAVGDWDGDGDDTVGIFRPSARRFFLSNANRQGFADIEFDFGETDWIPVAGWFGIDAVNAAPTVVIGSPPGFAIFEAVFDPDAGGMFATVDLIASISDPDDPVESLALSWTSDRYGDLGTGNDLEVRLGPVLSDTEFVEITATVTDPDGATATDERFITILIPSPS